MLWRLFRLLKRRRPHAPAWRTFVSLVLAVAVLATLAGTARGSVSLPPAISGFPEAKFDFESESAVLMDYASGQVLFAKNPEFVTAPASVTKIMTLLLVFEAVEQGKVGWDDVVVGSPLAASMGGTQIYLAAGERMKLWDLVRAVAIGSANDAAVAVAEHVAGSHENFVHLMNERAAELGMKTARFRNATGLDADGHEMSALDVAIMSRAAARHPELLKLTSIHIDHIREDSPKKFQLVNRNKAILYYDGADGLKTGYTDHARYCVSVTAQRNGTRLIAVVMGSPTPAARFKEIYDMLNWGFANFTSQEIASAGHAVATVNVVRGQALTVEAVPRAEFRVTVPKGREKELVITSNVSPHVMAPVARGDVLGQVIVRLDGTAVGQVDLVAARDVPRLGFFGTAWRFFNLLLKFR